MDSMQFAQVIPRLRVLETRLLDKAKIDRMIDGDSANEALKVLQESEYANVMTGVKRAEDYEIVLSKELKRVYELMYDISPEKSLVDLMAIKYDYNNLSDLPSFMRSGIEKAKEVFEGTTDPQQIDIILDNSMFEEMKEISKELNDRFVDKYVSALIDLTNLKTLLRVKKQNKARDFLQQVIINGGAIGEDTLVALLNDAPENISNKLTFTDYSEVIKSGLEDYIKTGSSSLLEKLIDNYIMDMMREAKFIPFGVEPLLAYIYAKETEIKVVRIIMVGKLNNISGEVIRERLRDIYV